MDAYEFDTLEDLAEYLDKCSNEARIGAFYDDAWAFKKSASIVRASKIRELQRQNNQNETRTDARTLINSDLTYNFDAIQVQADRLALEYMNYCTKLDTHTNPEDFFAQSAVYMHTLKLLATAQMYHESSVARFRGMAKLAQEVGLR